MVKVSDIAIAILPLPFRLRLVAFVVYAVWAVVVVVLCEKGGPVRAAALLVHKYSTRVVRTRYGPLRGVVVHARPPVEAYLGVPYATPPIGSLRYMPPVTPSQWRSTRLADRFSPVCPQRLPDISNRSEALLAYPRKRLLLLERLLPLLANQSEDCLYLNLFVPKPQGAEEEEPTASSTPLPCLVYIHGESYEWNSGNPYDGTLLASTGGVIVVTINFRLGVLGFLKTGSKGSAQGNFGLMDLIAGLHWLRENVALFGGDPQRVTLMGHGTGGALANFIAASPVAKELVHRVILLSGSGMSPWAIQRDPLWVKRAVAEHTGCHGDLHDDDLAPCLRLRPLDQLLGVRLETPRFLPGFAPFVDGTLLVQPTVVTTSTASSFGVTSFPEIADFPGRDLLISLTSCESYLDIDAQELRFGFDERRRDRILRTYVRNTFRFHLNEIFSALKNEYTDWERPTQNPLSVRDATLDVLSDGHTVAPLVKLANGHVATKGGRTFLMHFRRHEASTPADDDFPMKSGSVRGEELPYVLGLPMIGGGSFFPYNYSRTDAFTSKTLIRYISNFVKKGDPNDGSSNATGSNSQIKNFPEEKELETSMPYWDTYDSINQFYIEIGNRPERKDHYRGHKMSLWLNLIPQLHRPGDGEDVSMRHHHFQEEDEQFYDGFVLPQSKEKPATSFIQVIAPPPVPSSTAPAPLPPKSDTALQATTTECPPNDTNQNNHQQPVRNPNNLLRKLASNYHYQSYTTALTITIAVGCFLLLLNVLIFAGIYHQRGRARSESKEKNKMKEEEQRQAEAGSCSSSTAEVFEQKQHYPEPRQSYGCTSCAIAHQEYLESSHCTCACGPPQDIHMTEIILQQFNCSPVPAKRVMEHSSGGSTASTCTYPDVTTTGMKASQQQPQQQPPPDVPNHVGGILRPHRLPATPGTMKKRVQIQEISV